MVRVTNGYVRHKKHKDFRKQAKWFRLGRSWVYKQVRLALIRQGENAYVGRKLKKRQFRQLWIERLSAAVRERWGKYSQFMWKKAEKNIELDRKVLSNISIAFPEVFDKIYDEVVS